MQIQDGRAPTSYPFDFASFCRGRRAHFAPIYNDRGRCPFLLFGIFLSDVGSEDFFFPVKKFGLLLHKKNSCKDLGLDRLKKEKNRWPPKHGLYGVLLHSPGENFLPTVGLRKKKYRRDFFNSSSLKIYRAPKEKDRLPAIFFQGLC